MKVKELIDLYGTQKAVAKALGVSAVSVHKWVKAGVIPELRQYQIEKITKGKLKCESPVS